MLLICGEIDLSAGYASGVCAAVLGVILPLVVADVMRGTGRFNLGLGIVGSAVGIGGSGIVGEVVELPFDRLGEAA